jgi:enoyl-CoA hydratase
VQRISQDTQNSRDEDAELRQYDPFLDHEDVYSVRAVRNTKRATPDIVGPMNPDLLVEQSHGVLTVTFNRSSKKNALTPAMIADLQTACETANSHPAIRLVTLRGAGEAFCAGLDINYFADLDTPGDAEAWEQRLVDTLGLLENVRCPTLAVISGACAGAGLVLAAACDVRIASIGSYFALPIARTLGNCLSAYPTALLADRLGESVLLDLLTRAGQLKAVDALSHGFVSAVSDGTDPEPLVRQYTKTLTAAAPLTVWSTRQTLRRIRMAASPDTTDIMREVYCSRDFRSGATAFVSGHRMTWVGY